MAQIDKPNLHFNTKLYTGNGSTQNITGVGFQPDWTWTKKRNGTTGHRLVDAVRGVTKALFSNGTNAESTEANGLTAFASDGYALGTDGNYNNSSDTYVSWNWKAGGTASSNTDGSITSSVSANTTAGFSIITYTGTGSAATVGHALGVAPKVTIFKRRDSTNSWRTQTTVIDGSLDNLYLNLTDAKVNASNSAPTSSVLNLDTGTEVNASSGTYVAYNFAEIKGYSKFGTYTGNGNADGTFVYTGFKPAFYMVKQTNTSGEGWYMWDNKRSSSGGANENDRYLIASANNAEGTLGVDCDFLSNGVKTRYASSATNTNGSTYIYMAFAENPIVGSNNVPAVAS